MCDYSLMAFANRLAAPGEELVVYRFSGGTVGLAPAAEIRVSSEPEIPQKGFWGAVVGFFEPAESRVPAVCVAPGTLLLLRDIPANLMQEFGVLSSEQVTFTQVSAEANAYRDYVRFWNGKQLSLQRLLVGQRVRILDISGGNRLQILPELRPSVTLMQC